MYQQTSPNSNGVMAPPKDPPAPPAPPQDPPKPSDG